MTAEQVMTQELRAGAQVDGVPLRVTRDASPSAPARAPSWRRRSAIRAARSKTR
jgi:hypothetical protein